MAITTHVDITKKHRVLTLDDKRHIEVVVANMFEVHFMQAGSEVGKLRFSALSSLNNLEIKPHYLVYEASLTDETLFSQASPLFLAGIRFFKEYTNGKFKIAESVELKHQLSAFLQ